MQFLMNIINRLYLGRSAELRDVCIDMSGVIAGLIFAMIIIKIINILTNGRFTQ